MKVTMEISDHLIEQMENQSGLSASRVLKQASKLLFEFLLEGEDDGETGDCIEDLEEITPLVDQLYAGLRNAVLAERVKK